LGALYRKRCLKKGFNIWDLKVLQLKTFEDGVNPIKAPVEKPTIVVIKPEFSAIVLGSTQFSDAWSFSGIPIVKRNTGGSAVFIKKAQFGWVELYIPFVLAAGLKPKETFLKVGTAFKNAFGNLGLKNISIYHKQEIFNGIAKVLCFASRAKGEVVESSNEKKILGLSQRRTREFIKIQSGFMNVYDPEFHVDLYKFLSKEPKVSKIVEFEITEMAQPIMLDAFEVGQELKKTLFETLGF
jgi:lipoate-protein ligase A